jgi:hypothetical protein
MAHFLSRMARPSPSSPGNRCLCRMSMERMSPGPPLRSRSWSRIQRSTPRRAAGDLVASSTVGPIDETQHKTCFPCHEAHAKEHDFVFTRYTPRERPGITGSLIEAVRAMTALGPNEKSSVRANVVRCAPKAVSLLRAANGRSRPTPDIFHRRGLQKRRSCGLEC